MKKIGQQYELSASDLVGFLNCRYLTGLDCAVADGTRAKPKFWDPSLEILSERGSVHERKFVEHLEQAGLNTVRIADFWKSPGWAHEIRGLANLLAQIADMIQAVSLRDGRWDREGRTVQAKAY